MSAPLGSDSVCEISPASAMAAAKVFSFADLKASGAAFQERSSIQVSDPFCYIFEVVPWRCLEDGTSLMAPRVQDWTTVPDRENGDRNVENHPVLLDFTPGDDDWLHATGGIDYVGMLKKHHQSLETVACKVLLELPPQLGDDLDNLDKAIMEKAMDPKDVAHIGEGSLNWMPMLRTETAVMANIVLEGSDAPTKLTFILDDGSVHQGEGLEFFKAQLGDDKIEDFSCKVWAELQFIDVQTVMHRKMVAVKVHSMALAKTPKEKVVSFAQEHIDCFVRAAKRLKVRRL